MSTQASALITPIQIRTGIIRSYITSRINSCERILAESDKVGRSSPWIPQVMAELDSMLRILDRILPEGKDNETNISPFHPRRAVGKSDYLFKPAREDGSQGGGSPA